MSSSTTAKSDQKMQIERLEHTIRKKAVFDAVYRLALLLLVTSVYSTDNNATPQTIRSANGLFVAIAGLIALLLSLFFSL